jgi:hypothetical protein
MVVSAEASRARSFANTGTCPGYGFTSTISALCRVVHGAQRRNRTEYLSDSVKQERHTANERDSETEQINC